MAESREKCVFCRICDGKEEANIVYSDDDYVVFPDIKPATKHHYLVVTRSHIPNAKSVNKDQILIVEDLVRIGKQILEENGADCENVRFGFHWPPFNSISHLHLHVISPVQEMGFISRMIFKPDTWWFVSAEYVLSQLKENPSRKLDAHNEEHRNTPSKL